jgi:hypothetical protein
MIDPIAGFRLNPSKPEAFAGPIQRSRYRVVAVVVAFSTLVIGLPVVAVAAMLVWL